MSQKIRVLYATALAVCTVLLVSAQAQKEPGNGTSAVFAMTNAVEHNQVLAYQRNSDGMLGFDQSYSTGRGSGGTIDPLQSQDSLLLSQDHTLLFAANSGSGEVSSYRVHRSELVPADRVISGGSSPVALAQHGSLLYVLNAGGNDNVVGFRVDQNGQLSQIPGSIRELSSNDRNASSLAFSPDGRFLVVTERLTNLLDVFPVQSDGTLGTVVENTSAGTVPFAATFAPNGTLLVAEAGANTISSYSVASNGTLTVITSALQTLGQATCWNAVTPDGRFVYTSNAGTSSISGFAIGTTGALTPIGSTVVGQNPEGSTNLDITVTGDGKYLYSLNAGTGEIGMFAIQNDGTLQNLGHASGLPAGAGINGIAAL